MELCRVYFWTINHARPLHWSLASWRDSGRVTHELTERAPATPAEGYLVCLFFFAASWNTLLRPGLKASHESRTQKFCSGCLGSRCIRCKAPVAPRGGAAHSAAQVVIKLDHSDVHGQLARKKKNPIETHHRFAIVRFFQIDRDCTWKTERSRAVTLQQRGKINWSATVRARSY